MTFIRRLSIAVAIAGVCALVTKTGFPSQTELRGKASQEMIGDTDPASPPFIDVHTHFEAGQPDVAVRAALQAMTKENATRIVLMPPPFTSDDSGVYDVSRLSRYIRPSSDRLSVLGGGGSLNAMIQQSVKSGDAGPEVRRRFRRQADALLRFGAAGFGEMAGEHFQGATGYQSAPPDHPLFLLLADIAAEHGVPIDLHMEAVPLEMALPADLKSPPNPAHLHANIEAFERLLNHNPRAAIIWAHAGADYTGYRTPELCARLLAGHPNLYMEIKIDPAKPGRNPLLTDGGTGQIKAEWLSLLQSFPDRFVVGSDQHYPEPVASLQRWQAMVLLLRQLPPELRKKIAVQNALRLYFNKARSRRPE